MSPAGAWPSHRPRLEPLDAPQEVRDTLLELTLGYPQPPARGQELESVGAFLSDSHCFARSGQTEAEFIARLMPAAQRAAGDYDHLAESYAAPLPDPAEIRDTKFANGLEVILDGLALRLPG